MDKNVVENNNSFTKFNQVWSNYVYTDAVPDQAPFLENAAESNTFQNKDGTICTEHFFRIKTDNDDYNYLLHLSNFQLTKEFRQDGKNWKLEYGNNEESIRFVILPDTTLSRSYTPVFTDGEYEIPYTSVNPDFDFENCRLKSSLAFDKLYFSGWLYVGKTLESLLANEMSLPFASHFWLLKDKDTGNKVKFSIKKEATYKLPADDFNDTEDSDTIVTTNIFNQVANKFLDLDEGCYW